MQFETKTQFDNEYTSIIKERSSCSIFSLITIEQFLQNHTLNKEQHTTNIDRSVANFVAMNISGHISFGELLTHISDYGEGTQLSETDTIITNVDFLIAEETKFEDMIPNSEEPYGIIFLKDTKFFTVLYKDNKFYVRDSHYPFQYCFNNRELLKNHLNDYYQFNLHTTLSDGTVIYEFSVIEYLKFDKPFKTVYTELSIPHDETEEIINNTEPKDNLFLEELVGLLDCSLSKKASRTKDNIDHEVLLLIEQLNNPIITQYMEPETVSAIYKYLMSNFDIDEIKKNKKEIKKKSETVLAVNDFLSQFTIDETEQDNNESKFLNKYFNPQSPT